MTKYARYIRSDEWKRKRAAILRACKGRCESCQKRKATQVHHLTYKRLGRELHSDLVALCHKCHSREHPDKPHMRRPKLPKRVKCPWCPMRVTSERHLEAHMQARHGPGSRPTIEQLEHDRREAERARVVG
jgi:hypothetical protein